jgi:hypothetical protein
VIQLKESPRVLPVAALLVGLTLYSYHGRELLVCWLCFTVLFVSVMLVILIGELGVYAGESLAVRARTLGRMTPVAATSDVRLLLKKDPGR